MVLAVEAGNRWRISVLLNWNTSQPSEGVVEEKRFVQFRCPRSAETKAEPIPIPSHNQVLVKSVCSAVSAGTELLVYRGELPTSIPLDATIDELADQTESFPVRYGYAAVGHVVELGQDVDPKWLNQLVFAFHPHESHFCISSGTLIPVPAGISAEDAAFLPNMETAVSLVMDSRPMIGETIVVLGLGIVGQLTLKLLSNMPLANCIGVDGIPSRRNLALKNGASAVYDPSDPALGTALGKLGADAVLELSGNPKALDLAVKLAGYNGRIVIGSWYGTKQASVDFGGHFHRSNIQLVASQVSRLHPSLTGRWTKARRLDVAWQMIKRDRPSEKYVTHRSDAGEAKAIYKLIDERPDEALQVIFTY